MIARTWKVQACLILALAVVFYLFWQLCKQQPALAQAATFTEDPYDAVGSFGTQLALLIGFIGVVRAFRPTPPNKLTDNQQLLLVRGMYFTCLSIAVTLGADVVAMLRYPGVWFGMPAGFALAALVGGMTLLDLLMVWQVHRSARTSLGQAQPQGWVRAIGISLAGIIICALYPQNWRAGFPVGGLGTVFIFFTVLLGMVLCFLSVWAWGMVLAPTREPASEDFLDDLAVLYTRIKTHAGPFRGALAQVEKLLCSSWLRPIVNWFNPRQGRWYGIALIGLAVGVFLALGEGHLHLRLGLVEVFAIVEGLAVVLGYAIFEQPLGLARRDAQKIAVSVQNEGEAAP